MTAEEIFHAAIDTAQADRAGLVAALCGGDEPLRRRVEDLLHAHDNPASFLAGRPPMLAVTVDQQAGECRGTVVGPYKLLEQIGEGGFGVVFVAEQTEPVRRKVALKVLKAGMDTRQVVARFEAERQALAIMDHPNIAKVFDGGTTPAGRPYLVMELVKGVPVTEFCDANHLTPRQRLELFVPVCQAVQHAHQKGVIHRDLKPSNVLVSRHDSIPVVKVIDFGVAKALGQELTDKTLFTGLGQMVGTPLYMSPEQAGRSDLDVDTRSDVYSLGVLLYELLTGSTPFTKERFRRAAYDEIRRIIREEDPPKPSTRLSESTDSLPSVAAQRQTEPAKLSRLVRGELDWIVMKALEKDRNRRYETANGFALDVQRYLADEPVLACPPTLGYRLRKFARRNKGRLAVAAVVLTLLAALAGMAGWAALQQAKQRVAQRATLETDIGRDLQEAQAFCREDRLREASAVLDHAQALVARGGAEEDLGGGVAQVRKDVDMAARLEAIRLERATVKNEHFDTDGVDVRYAETFRDYGLDLHQLEPDKAAARIAVSAIREHLIAAMYDWMMLTSRPNTERLLAVLAGADADPWRRQLLVACVDNNPKALRELAGDPNALAQPPASALVLAAGLIEFGEMGQAVDFLRRAQQEYPSDFWLNEKLGQSLMCLKSPGAAEAVGYLRAALVSRPDSPGALLNLGDALSDQGDMAGAIAANQKAITLKPDYAAAHYNLGNALLKQGNLPGAVAAYQKAIAIKPDHANIYYNLGYALHQQGNLPGAVAAYQKGIALKPDLASAHCNLGLVLQQQGDLAGAIDAYQKAIALKPDLASAHCNLGLVLQQRGEFAKALDELRRGHEIGSKDPGWNYSSAQWVRQCQRLLELDGRLPDFLDGKAKPANAGERIELAQLCAHKRLNPAALRFYEEAFATQPTLLASHRYNAACAAALAGCDRDKGTVKLDDKERTRLRRLALDWLCADLEVQGRLLDKEPARNAAKVATHLQHWLTDPDLIGVREPKQLAKLSPEEQCEWGCLWNEVAEQAARGCGATQRISPASPATAQTQPLGKEAAPPPNPSLLVQAHYYVRRSQWDKAAAEYAKVDFGARPLDDDAFAYACLFLIRGDSEGYNRFCQGMIERAAQTQSHFEAYVLARSRAVARTSPVEPARGVQWANQAVAAAQPPWYIHALGLAQYRAGQFDHALQSLTEANIRTWSYSDLSWFGLALVHHRLGHSDEARRCLDKGNQWLERNAPPGPERTTRLQPADWLEAEVLRREANELMGIDRAKK